MDRQQRVERLAANWHPLSKVHQLLNHTPEVRKSRAAREIEIVRLVDAGVTQSHIARSVGVTHERIRQMMVKGKRVMRHPQYNEANYPSPESDQQG